MRTGDSAAQLNKKERAHDYINRTCAWDYILASASQKPLQSISNSISTHEQPGTLASHGACVRAGVCLNKLDVSHLRVG